MADSGSELVTNIRSFVQTFNRKPKNICSWKQPKRKYLSWLKLNRKQWPINTYSNWNWQYLFNWFEMVRSKVFGASSARFKSNWKAKVYRGTNCKMIFLKIKGEESNKSMLRKTLCVPRTIQVSCLSYTVSNKCCLIFTKNSKCWLKENHFA